MTSYRRIGFVGSALLIFGVIIGITKAEPPAQSVVSPTPVPINLPSPLPFITQQSLATETPTRTPTPIGPALLEAITEANVRAQPDPESERLGTIRSGEVYPVIGRFFRWYQFQYQQSPSGTGWVFDELVRIIGDETSVIDLNEQAAPTVDTIAQAATETFAAITQTPGGILTATASVLLPALPGQGNSQTDGLTPVGGIALPTEVGVLPTYTFPADVALLVPTQPASESGDATSGDASPLADLELPSTLPPIVIILALGGGGFLGLLISSYRRR
ncbi:MAG: SH3 domain-containing protein [Anaerolineae bacterium]|nr:SH3 domain-containing protein [Anaerolineae bacterium]